MQKSKSFFYPRFNLPLVISFFGLCFILFKLLYKFENVWEFMSYDEAYHIHYTIVGHLGSDGIFYRFYLTILNQFSTNPIALYRTNFALVTIIFGFSSFVFTYKVTKSAFLAFLFSYFFLIVNPTFSMSPSYITHFNASVMMLVFTFALGRKKDQMLIILLIGAVILTFIRPEYSLTLLLSIIVVSFYVLYQYLTYQHFKYPIIITLLIASFLLIKYNPTDGQRSSIAFCQHYAYGLFQFDLWKEDPWSYCELAMSKDFGSAKTISEALIANPSKFLGHVVRNILILPKELGSLLIPFFSGEPGNNTVPVQVAAYSVILIVLFWFIGFFFSLYQGQRNLLQKCFVLIYAMPVLVSTILIYPRPHYLLMVVPFLLIFGIQNLREKFGLLRYKAKFSFPIKTILVASILIYVTPWRLSGKSGLTIPEGQAGIHGKDLCTSVDNLNFLNHLNFENREMVLLSNLGFISTFLPKDMRVYHHFDKNSNFDEFILRNKINLVWINSALLNDLNFRNDSEFKKLVIGKSKGWKRMNIPNCPNDFLLFNF